MVEILGQARVTEAILFFVLVFILPMTAIILLKLRKYEAMYGVIPRGDRKAGDRKRARERPEPPKADPIKPDVFPYRKKAFLEPSDRLCLQALEEAMGEGTRIHAKVALWEVVQSMDRNPGYAERLRGKMVDFLLCDAATSQPFAAVSHEPGGGELAKICAAAETHLVLIPRADAYDPARLRETLGVSSQDA